MGGAGKAMHPMMKAILQRRMGAAKRAAARHQLMLKQHHEREAQNLAHAQALQIQLQQHREQMQQEAAQSPVPQGQPNSAPQQAVGQMPAGPTNGPGYA